LEVADHCGYSSEVCENIIGNSHHREVKIDSMKITANAVQSPQEIVRRAKFRETLAQTNQLLLFPGLDDRQRGDFLYAMILHGPDYDDKSRVAFIQLVFPSPDCSKYLLNINLSAHCDIQLYAPGVSEEIFEDIAIPKLREDIREKKKG